MILTKKAFSGPFSALSVKITALLVALALPATAVAGPRLSRAPVGGSLVDACYDGLGHPINTPQYAVCRGFQATVDSVASLCRMPMRSLPNEGLIDDCGLIDGRAISEAQIAAYRKTWVSKAIVLQQVLGRSASLYEEQIAGTHNSFNASSYLVPLNGKPIQYFPSLTNQDPNQVYSITDQLQMGIRGLEIDLHWVPSIYGSASTGGYWVDVCHGQSTAIPNTGQNVHVGCTTDRSLQNTLAEVRSWLNAHRHQFLLVYLENQLDNNLQGHDIAASIIRKAFGHLVYRPPASLKAGQCADMPYGKSEAAMMRTGARVLLVGNCGPGNAWNHLVFTRGDKWNEGGNPTTYGAADCRADTKAHDAHAVFRRWYEESPFLEAAMEATQTLSPAALHRMVSCGVNLTGIDQLTPTDGRLKAFVWSWAPGEPGSRTGCAYQAASGRFRAGDCQVKRHAACVGAHDKWRVTEASGPARAGERMCSEAFPGSHFGVPPDGLRNLQLHRARPSKRSTVWLDYATVHGRWRAGALG
ncbi:MAG TPA: hypothetical protein VHC43_07840 [Mycobacteriales bacterium]|nr:hypothetical protein [Mycobacteriales bacterium]